jgi:hypothetical protein
LGETPLGVLKSLVENMTTNIVHSIEAYRLPESPKLWGFDDERHGLRGEPLLWDASDFITAVVGDNCRKARLLFSEHPFPGVNCKLTRTWTGSHYERAGCEYRSEHPLEKPTVSISAWLCPAVIHYFKKECAPEFIYAAVSRSEA